MKEDENENTAERGTAELKEPTQTDKNESCFDPRELSFVGSYDQWDDEFPDTEGIGYHTSSDGSVIGYIESVNGASAEACWEFQATRHEMRLIAKYWYRQLTDLDLLWFRHQATGSTEWRTAKYAKRRLRRIRRLIGNGPVDEAISEVDAELCREVGEAEWERFQAER